MQYSTVVARENDDTYIAWHPEIEGVLSDGQSVEEARANLVEVTRMVLEHFGQFNLPVPTPMLWGADPIAIDFGKYC